MSTRKLKVGDLFRPKEDYYYDYSLPNAVWVSTFGKDPTSLQPYGRVYADQVYRVVEMWEGSRGFNFVLVKGNHVVYIFESSVPKVSGGSLELDQIELVKKPPTKDKKVSRFVAILKGVVK